MNAAIQVGRLPVYIYDVFQWTAYEGTEIAIDEFGFVSQLGHADVLAERLVQVILMYVCMYASSSFIV